MTKKDAIRLVAIMVKAYPNSDKYNTADDIAQTVNLWAMMFQEDPTQLVEVALAKHIQTSKWPPSIAEIREIIAEIQNPDLLPPDQAWLLVSDLMSAHGEYGGSHAVRKMPEAIRRVVESIGYTNLIEMHRAGYRGGKPGLDRVAFNDLYKPAYDRERTRAQLSLTTKKQIEALEGVNEVEGSRKALDDARIARIEKENFYRQLGGEAPIPTGRQITQTTRDELPGE